MSQYTIRVYALIIHRDQILLSDECLGDTYFTKFPGGGHQWGEGIAHTVKRELREELNAEVESMEHFYTTDFFVASKFDPQKQVISIYYKVRLANPGQIEHTETEFDFDKDLPKAESFRWVPLNRLTPETVTFPVDKKVVKLLKENKAG